MIEDETKCLYVKLEDGKLSILDAKERAKLQKIIAENSEKITSLMEEAQGVLGAISYEFEGDKAIFVLSKDVYTEGNVVCFDAEEFTVSIYKGSLYSIPDEDDYLLKNVKVTDFIKICRDEKIIRSVENEELVRRISICLESWGWI